MKPTQSKRVQAEQEEDLSWLDLNRSSDNAIVIKIQADEQELYVLTVLKEKVGNTVIDKLRMCLLEMPRT